MPEGNIEYIFSIDDWYFQWEIPTGYSQLKTTLPLNSVNKSEPEPFKASVPGGAGAFSCNTTPDETFVQIVLRFQLDKTTWQPDE